MSGVTSLSQCSRNCLKVKVILEPGIGVGVSVSLTNVDDLARTLSALRGAAITYPFDPCRLDLAASFVTGTRTGVPVGIV
jgi:hypothetical protein